MNQEEFDSKKAIEKNGIKDMDMLKEMTIKAIENCKTCQCNQCPFKEHPSYCLAVLEYLIKAKEDKKRDDSYG